MECEYSRSYIADLVGKVKSFQRPSDRTVVFPLDDEYACMPHVRFRKLGTTREFFQKLDGLSAQRLSLERPAVGNETPGQKAEYRRFLEPITCVLPVLEHFARDSDCFIVSVGRRALARVFFENLRTLVSRKTIGKLERPLVLRNRIAMRTQS
jgi:hypothetical protein